MNFARRHRRPWVLPRPGLLWVLLLSSPAWITAPAWAQSGTETNPGANVETGAELAIEQGELADKFSRLEKLFLRLADVDQTENPQRAELLRRAFSLSQERKLRLQYERLVELISREEYGRSLANQKTLRSDLQALLQLLLTENRADRLKGEKARVREYLRELGRLERWQRSIQGRTEGGVESDALRREQGQVADRTQKLHQKIEEAEKQPNPEGDAPDRSASSPPAESVPGEEPSASGEGKEPSSSDSPPTPADPSPSQPAPQAPATPGSSGESSPGDSSSDPSSQGESSQSNPSFPGQENLRRAEQAMRRAEQKLREAEKSQAIEEQRAAARELARAREELERILRQMREEEIERALALLEARLKHILQLQVQVHEETVRLDQQDSSADDRTLEIEAGKLGLEQRRILVETDRARNLLLEEGSSIALTESLSQVRGDMEQVAARLTRALFGTVTQGIQEDIIASLEEMLEALKKAQQDQRDRRNGNQPSSGAPGEQPLVDIIAELKMIKTLQLRINRRTDRYAQLLQDENDDVGQATDQELIEALRELAAKEARLRTVTRDIVLGKNR